MKPYRAILDDRNTIVVIADNHDEARDKAFGQLLLVWLKTGRLNTIDEVVEA